MNIKKIAITCALLLFAPTIQASEITVSAASSLTGAITELKQAFIEQNPTMKIYTNFAASNTLLRQIEKGAPVDIFASADQITMDKAESSNLILNETRENFALNTLVLIVPNDTRDAKNIPSSPQDLLNKNYKKIAIGNIASVPAGRYAKESLESEKLWNDLKNRFIYAENVRQVLDYVTRGEVDAGFVYATDAATQKNKVKIAVTMQGHQPVSYPIALLKDSKNKQDAQKFLDFIFSDQGTSILTKHGFTKPAI